MSVTLVALWLIAAVHGSAMADENFRWRVDSFDTLVNKPETTYFETEPEALAYKQKYEKVQNLQKGGPAYINWKITKERKPAKPDGDKAKSPKSEDKKGGDVLSRLRDAKAAVGMAMKASKEELAKRELLLREAIDDYKQAVLDSYRRIQEFEKTLLGGTQEMQEKRFREINSLVDQYNRQVSEFQSVMGPSVHLGHKPLPRFQSPSLPVPADTGSLVGRTWNVTEIKCGDHYKNNGEKVAGRPLAVEFRAGGAAMGIYLSNEHSGTWSESDGIVTIRLNSYGRRGYSSYVEGFRIRGRRNPDGSLQVLEWAQDVP